MRRVPVEDAAWTGVAWLNDAELVLGYIRGIGPARLARVGLDGTFNEIRLPTDEDCLATQYRFPTVAQGVVVAIEECMLLQPGARSTYSLVEVDETAEDARPFLGTPTTYWISTVSVSAGGDAAAVTVGGSLCSTIGVLRGSGLELPTLVIRDGDRAWSLDEGYPVPNRGHACTPFGQAAWPAWSPDGPDFAFFASPESIGVDGQARGEAPFNLYVMEDPATSVYSVLLRNIGRARALTWSPSGDQLAFSGQLADEGSGTWVFNPETKELFRILEDEAEYLDWSPDGDRLAIVRPTSSEDPRSSEIVIVKVGEAMPV